MAEPMKRSPEMEKAFNGLSRKLFGTNSTDAVKQDVCVDCKSKATEFTSELAKAEYSISGLCQKCQDVVFEGGDSED